MVRNAPHPGINVEGAPDIFILWVGKSPVDGEAGDEVFDRKTIQALRDLGHTVSVLHPVRGPRWLELWNILRGVPRNRARFATRENRQLVKAAQNGHDLTICSWEPFDALTSSMTGPLILIAHNITSRALPKIFPFNPIAWLLAFQALWWERAVFRSRQLVAIATLSRKDRDYVASLPGVPPVLLTIPGMPPVTVLKPEARVTKELVLSGTYDWLPKRRDAVRFAAGYAREAKRLPVLCERLPKQAAGILAVLPLPATAEAAETIRFGIISDRFEFGHKLKTLAYIAQNQIVLSFSDVNDDVSGIPDHAFFIRRIRNAADIAQHVASISAQDPGLLRDRLVRFQLACAERFNWEAVAHSLVDAARQAAGGAGAGADATPRDRNREAGAVAPVMPGMPG